MVIREKEGRRTIISSELSIIENMNRIGRINLGMANGFLVNKTCNVILNSEEFNGCNIMMR
jgi:hypothetical protein